MECSLQAKYDQVFWSKGLEERILNRESSPKKGKHHPEKSKEAIPQRKSYVIKEELRFGTYNLKRMDGMLVPNTWHADNFRQYYA